MLRLSSRRLLLNLKQSNCRGLSSSRLLLKEVEGSLKPPAGQQQIGTNGGTNNSGGQGRSKKRFSLFGFLFKTSLVASVVYGGVLFAATKNEDLMDFIIDKQPPYYEELLNVIENGSFEGFEERFDELKEKFQKLWYQLPTTAEIDEFAQKLEHRSEGLIEETKKKFGSKKANLPPVDSADATPAQQLQKPVETVQRTIEHLPLVKLNRNAESYVDTTVKSTIDSFNDLILSIDASAQKTPRNEALIKAINENVSHLADKLNKLTEKFDDELQSKLKVSQTELLSSYTKKELELTENLLYQYNNEKLRMEKRLNQTLKTEVEAAKEALFQAALNAVSMTRIEQVKEFESLIKDKIDQERDGRLANLDNLNSRVVDLEAFAENLDKQITANHKKSLLQRAVAKLKSLVLHSESDDKPKLIAPYSKALYLAATDCNDELIELSAKELAPLLSNESSQSVLTTPQLLARWKDLEPELRSAALLPPNAGLLGHLASIFFSKLLVPVKGSRPDGRDIESVIARVEDQLTRGQLDLAVEEVANLKGWTRKLANDWVLESRKRLEIDFLLSLIETESLIL